ncbi:MAG: restriction endonuclease subunit S [Thermodesulfobacteriota bacterium]
MTIVSQPKHGLTTEPVALGSDLPEGWVETTLDQLLQTLESGSRPKGGVRGITEGVPSIGGEHLDNTGGFRFESIKFVPFNFFKRMNRGRIQAGDILVVKDGATTGKVALVRENFPYDPAVINEHVFICRPVEGVYSPFLFYFLFSDEGQDRVLENFRGSAQGGINQNFALGTIVPVAPKLEQKRIVAKVEQLLARVNVVRERLAKVPGILKRFRQSVLAAACSGKLTADWRESQTNITPVELSIREILRLREKQWTVENGSARKYKLPQRVTTDSLPMAPEGWKYVSSDALFSFVTSGSRGWAKYYADSGSTFIRIGNMDHDAITLDLSKIQCVNPPRGSERHRTRVQAGDILISITADVGMIALVSDGIGEAYVNQHVAIARPVDGVYRPWLAWYLASAEGGQAQFQNLQRGATKVGLGLNDIRSVAIPFPPIEEQKEIMRRIEVLFKMSDAIEKRVTRATVQAEKLTQAILAKAFRGDLVPQDPNDEPASVLLERIQSVRFSDSSDIKTSHLRSSRRKV